MLFDRPSARPSGDVLTASAPARPSLVAIAAFVVGCATAGLATWMLTGAEREPQPVRRLSVQLPSAHGARDLAVSPDGARLAYVGQVDSRPRLFLRTLDSYAIAALAGTEGATRPFFSADGERIGFFAEGELRSVALVDGRISTLAQTRAGTMGAAWLAEGSLVMADLGSGGMVRLSSDGGAPVQLTVPDPARDERLHGWPVALPGGRGVVFTVTRQDHATRLAILDLESLEWRHLYPATGRAQVVAGDLLVYQLDADLLALAFDPETLEIRGGPVTIGRGVAGSSTDYQGLGRAGFGAAVDGLLVYVAGDPSDVENRLVRVGRDGAVTALSDRRARHAHPRLSPDGRRLAFEISDTLQRGQVWVHDLDRDRRSAFTDEGADNRSPTWSPDGRTLVFASNRAGPQNIFERPSTGSGEAVRRTTSGSSENPVSWSTAGNVIAFYRVDEARGRDVWILTRDGEERPVLATPHNERSPALSPDGRFLAYVSDESGRDAVHVRRFPDVGEPPIVSLPEAVEPVWSPDARELFAWVDDRLLRIGRTESPEGDAFEPPVVVFERRFVRDPGANLPNYDVGIDGAFVMVEPADAVTAIRVVTGVDAEVREHLKAAGARVPRGR